MKKRLVYLLFFTFILCLTGCDKVHKHSLVEEWKIDELYHWNECDNCDELVNKAQHTWDEGVVIKEATELEDGEKLYTCTVCSTIKKEILSALGHTHEFATEYSYDELFHWYAATCEHKEETKFKELHNYKFEVISSSTCEDEEVLLGTCVCGDTMIMPGNNAHGHSVSNYIPDNNATCTEDGTKKGICDICNELVTSIDSNTALGHEWVEKIKEPTYEEAGVVYHQCNVCDEVETLEVIPQLISVSEIEITGDKFIAVNSTETLVPSISPINANDKTLTWSSSDEAIATVTQDGLVETFKTGKVTITAKAHNDIEQSFEILVIETAIDSEANNFYNGVTPFTGKRSNPIVTHESYVKLGEDGIYIYQIITDSSGETGKAHVEWYITLGDTKVSNDSFSMHVYFDSAPNIRTYTYTSDSNVARNDNLAVQYCDYSTKLIGNENGLATYAYEMFIDYNVLGVTDVPESIKAQVRVISGAGNPLINSLGTSGLDYKDINYYEEFNENGYDPEILVDSVKDEIYDNVVPYTGSRTNPNVTHETYIKLGEKGIYAYQVVTDNSGSVSNAHVEFYFTFGDEIVADDSFSIHLYYDGNDNVRTYLYSSTTNVSRNDKLAGMYCKYSIKQISYENGLATYAYELFVDYAAFGLLKTPQSVNAHVRAVSGKGNPIYNNTTSALDYKDIDNYEKYGVYGHIDKRLIDGEKDAKYDSVLPVVGKRSEPYVSQECYVYLGEDGIYVYQLVEDGSGSESSAHVEWYFTLGDNKVLDDSLSIHLYYKSTPYIRSYVYSSTSNVARNDKLAAQYCDYAIQLINNDGGVATYAYELFVDYSYFGLTEAPKTIKAQMRAQSGSGSPLTNSTKAGALDYKDIANYYTFDKHGYVYSDVVARNIELDPSDIISGKYEIEFTLHTLNILNKLSNAKFTGVGSEYITEIGDGRYRLSIPVDKMANFAEEQKITVVDDRNMGANFTIKILEEVKTTYKVLMIGNSFSDDTIQWVYEICEDLGIEITIANLYIGGAKLDRHLKNLLNDVNEYTYVEYDMINKAWIRNENVSISEALTYEKWNYISLQQGSESSGKAETYNDINKIMDEILKLKNNVEFIWNMTWAYQQNSTHSGFANYSNNQNVMYNAIIDAVEEKVLTNERIKLVNPVGTAVQNARTSFVGDTLTRDGHHLSYDLGRYIAGLTMVGTLTGADLTKVKYSPNLDDKHRDMAIESVINAINNPYSITQSTFID